MGAHKPRRSSYLSRELPGGEPLTDSYEVKSDMQIPMSFFLNSMPEDYAAIKDIGDEIVTLVNSGLPTDHTTTCSLWMIGLLSQGF